MTNDSINDEILRIKRELAAKFDNDLARIVPDTRLHDLFIAAQTFRPAG